MTFDEAKSQAAKVLEEHPRYGGQLVIVDAYTIETATSWVFFYGHRKFIKTNDEKFRLYGNPPIEVQKMDGSMRKASISEVHELRKKFKPEDIRK